MYINRRMLSGYIVQLLFEIMFDMVNIKIKSRLTSYSILRYACYQSAF
jgi:hypothetical protein